MQPVAIGIEEVHIGDEVGPIVVHAVQAQSIISSNEIPQHVIMPDENKDQQTLVVQPLPGHSIMVQSVPIRFLENQEYTTAVSYINIILLLLIFITIIIFLIIRILKLLQIHKKMIQKKEK